jgi:hypothetical protein
MFGCAAAEAPGQLLERFIPARFRATHRAYVRGFATTGVTNRAMGKLGSLTALRADGREFPILHTLASLRESVRRHRLELCLGPLGGAELSEQVFPEVHRFFLQLNARLQGFLITAHGLLKDLVYGLRRCRGRLFGIVALMFFPFFFSV